MRFYSSKDLTPPEGLMAQSTRGLATTYTLFKGISVQEICNDACCGDEPS